MSDLREEEFMCRFCTATNNVYVAVIIIIIIQYGCYNYMLLQSASLVARETFKIQEK